ncbi:MAG: pyrroline-5-carboxylate reductase [Gammaproteobacteria bacterium]|nr:pyrroline-5-carboxylate reductase [Gammaproteobacteria bacterium]
MQNMTIGIIGAGNMGRALAAGLGATPGGPHALVYDHSGEARQRATQQGLTVAETLAELVAWANVLVLAVKPQHIAALAREITGDVAARHPLIVSVAAGIRTDALRHWLGSDRVARAMPNTPALIGAGATVLYAPPDISAGDRAQVEALLRPVSALWWVDDEDLMDAATAVSGSGPAYFFLVIEALAAAAVRAGLPEPLAVELATATALGAARMAGTGTESPAALRRQVTSPNGTTERAIQSFMDQGIMTMFATAVEAARVRAAELGRELGGL